MKKINFLMLFALVALLFNCRTEDLSEKDNSTNQVGSSSKFTSRKVSPAEFQKVIGLNEKFSKNERLLAQKMSTGKNIMEGAVIDSAYSLETTDGVVISYTFPVYRNNQKGFFENLVLQRKIGEQSFKSYLYKYPRVGANKYDDQHIEIYNIDDVLINTTGKLNFVTTSSITGCYEIQTTSADCGFSGHHTNGQYCPQSGAYMPYDYATIFDNCPSSGGGGSGSSNPGNNNPSPGPDTGYGVTTPVPNYPKWGICSERTGAHWDAFGLNSSQLAFINAYAQNALRGEMMMFLGNNEVFTFDCNAPRDISPDVKSVGLWIINYAMTNPDFLNSEFWADFINGNLQVQSAAINYLSQNNLSWPQAEQTISFVVKFVNENPDTEDIPNIFNRIVALDNALAQNPNLLLDIPCGELPKWQELANHPIPQSVKNKIFQVNGLTGWFSSAEIQSLDYSTSYTINMDVYPVKISNMPEKSPGVKYTPAEFFDYFRRNINDFTDINHGNFYPVVEPTYGIDDTNLWFSNNPLNSLITIKIPADNGTVICSGWGPQAWIFTTVKSPWDGEHPVSGNRLFGYFIDANGDMFIYTRGVDRFTTKVSNNGMQYTIENFGYSAAKEMWENMQQKVKLFVDNKGGTSSVIPGVDYKPNYIFIKDYLKGKKPITALGCH